MAWQAGRRRSRCFSFDCSFWGLYHILASLALETAFFLQGVREQKKALGLAGWLKGVPKCWLPFPELGHGERARRNHRQLALRHLDEATRGKQATLSPFTSLVMGSH